MLLEGMEAVSCVLLTNDVVKAVPFHTATALLSKLWPFTVRVKPAPPAAALLGESEVIDGVEGQEQATTGSRKIANGANISGLLMVIIVAMAQVTIEIQKTHFSQSTLEMGHPASYWVTVTWITFEVIVLLPLT